MQKLEGESATSTSENLMDDYALKIGAYCEGSEYKGYRVIWG